MISEEDIFGINTDESWPLEQIEEEILKGDYRMLNQLLPKLGKAYSKAKGVLTLVPFPKIDEIYAKLEGSNIYSTFDMRSGHYHNELSQESQPKSAFVVGGPKGGKWEFKRCPFGLTQAPAYFQM